jgi:hypothetical protein
VDNYGVVSVDAKDADLQQVAIKGGADAHREVVSRRHWAMALRAAWSMFLSVMPCL